MRGVRTKLQYVYLSLLQNNHTVIALTETWMTDDINTNELIDVRYNVFRHDRNYNDMQLTRGGWVLVAINKDVSVQPMNDVSTAKYDHIWLKLYNFQNN